MHPYTTFYFLCLKLWCIFVEGTVWLFLKCVVLPHHLQDIPPTSRVAPTGTGTGANSGGGLAVPSAIADSVSSRASSSVQASSSSSLPCVCLIRQFFTNVFLSACSSVLFPFSCTPYFFPVSLSSLSCVHISCTLSSNSKPSLEYKSTIQW